MIHRSFLSDSSTNPAISFTRRTCIAASKTIIKEYKLAIGDDKPTLWIYQAFSVAASIILLLHRKPVDSEYTEHKKPVEDTVDILRQCQNSMIATRGVELLSALLGDVSSSSSTTNRKRRHDGSQLRTDLNGDSGSGMRHFRVSEFVKTYCNGKKQNNTTAFRNAPQGHMVYSSTTDGSKVPIVVTEMGRIPSQSLDLNYDPSLTDDVSFFPPALSGGSAFKNLLYLAIHDFSGNHL